MTESGAPTPGLNARDDRLQTKGRQDNAALPLDSAGDHGGPERYPSARRDDAIEVLEPKTNPEPPQGAGDSSVNSPDDRP